MVSQKASDAIIATRRKWVTALRSGDYTQCKGALSREMVDGSEEFCCLGVLGRVVDPHFGDRFHSAYLDAPFDAAAGLNSRIRQLLSSLNDTYGRSFEQIADLIEKNIDLSVVRFSVAIDREVNRLWDERYGRFAVPK